MATRSNVESRMVRPVNDNEIVRLQAVDRTALARRPEARNPATRCLPFPAGFEAHFVNSSAGQSALPSTSPTGQHAT